MLYQRNRMLQYYQLGMLLIKTKGGVSLPLFLKLLMKKLIAEALGTFGIVFLGTGAIIVDEAFGNVITHPGVSFVFGAAVMLMILLFADISGAHLNPAVTWSLAIHHRSWNIQLLTYPLAQFTGACGASALLHWLFPGSLLLGATLPAGSAAVSWIMEFVLSGALLLSILLVSARKKIIIASVAGLAVMLEALWGGPISGASMNPARSLGPAFVSGHWEYFWIYLSAPVAGMWAAVFCYRIMKHQ